MSVQAINLQPIDIRQATEQEYAALHRFDNIMRAERTPEDPAHSLAEDIAGWQNIPAFVQLCNWIVWSDDGRQVIATGGGGYADWETNRHRRRSAGLEPLTNLADRRPERFPDDGRFWGATNRSLVSSFRPATRSTWTEPVSI